MTDTYESLTCPLPDCGECLHLSFTTTQGLFTDVLSVNGSQPDPSDAHTQTWQVVCENGHVLLLPGPAACPHCDGENCRHYDRDTSEDHRTFREHDADRLRVTLERMAAR